GTHHRSPGSDRWGDVQRKKVVSPSKLSLAAPEGADYVCEGPEPCRSTFLRNVHRDQARDNEAGKDRDRNCPQCTENHPMTSLTHNGSGTVRRKSFGWDSVVVSLLGGQIRPLGFRTPNVSRVPRFGFSRLPDLFPHG